MQDIESLLKKQRYLGGDEPNKDDHELFINIKDKKYNLDN